MSERTAAACRAEELAFAAARFEAAEACTIGGAPLEGGLPGRTTHAICRPESCA